MANISYRGAVRAIVGALEDRVDVEDFIGDDPDNVFYTLLGTAQQALCQYIDNGLSYTADILELWDGSTHGNTYLGGPVEDIMSLVTQSVFFQLEEDWAEAIYDGIDEWLTNVTGLANRTAALEVLTGEGEAE